MAYGGGIFGGRAPSTSQSLLDRPSTVPAVCSQAKILCWNAEWLCKAGRRYLSGKTREHNVETIRGSSSRIKACRQTESHSNSNPAVVYSQRNQRREFDAADPDDWWGVHLHPISGSNHVPLGNRKASEDAQMGWDFHGQTDFQTMYQQNGTTRNGNTRTYYYHEYHYMSYYFEKHGQYSHRYRKKRTRHAADGYAYNTDLVSNPGAEALELAHCAFQAALATARREMSPMDDEEKGIESTRLRELEKSIAVQVHEAAGHCGFDVIAFARVVGVLPPTKEQSGGPEAASEDSYCHESLRKKARKKIIITFHPDKLLHLHRSGKHLRYFLGHAVLQAVSSMPK